MHENKAYIENFELLELIAFSLYLIIIFFISRFTVAGKIRNNPQYRYYIPGLLAKLIAAIVFCFMYVYYYKGGDTIAYFESARAFSNLFYERPGDFFRTFFTEASKENYYLFDSSTGYPWPYMYFDIRTLYVIRIISLFLIISFNSYLISTILLAWVSFLGIWRLYLMFYSYYPRLGPQLALAVLFIPSVLFWGSGILKDTITLTCLAWFLYSFDKMFIRRRKVVINGIGVLITSYLILIIKPYIIIALFPGALVWLFVDRIRRIKSNILRFMAIPFIYIAFFSLGFSMLKAFSAQMGRYSMDKILATAVETQQDLKKEYYGGNRFDIGDFDASVGGVVTKAPVAIVAGLFRPFLWEAKSVVMIFSGFENLFLVIMLFSILYKIKFRHFFKILVNNPLLIFSFSYSVIFAFSIGLTTANFGALVRFKIAFLPIFVASLFILRDQISSVRMRSFFKR